MKYAEQTYSDQNELDSDTEEQLLASIYYSKNFNLLQDNDAVNESNLENSGSATYSAPDLESKAKLEEEEEISKYKSISKPEDKASECKNKNSSSKSDFNEESMSLYVSSDSSLSDGEIPAKDSCANSVQCVTLSEDGEISEDEADLEQSKKDAETNKSTESSTIKHHFIDFKLTAEEETSYKTEGLMWNVATVSESSEENLVFSSSDSNSDIEEINNQDSRYYGNEKAANMCFNCKSSGHTYKECPKANGGLACCFCGEYTHLKSACPFEICYNCYKPGHQSRACNLPRKRRSNERDQCDKCLLFGHVAKECSTSWRQYSFVKNFNRASFEEGMRKIRKFCYCCSAKGHFGDDCPRSKKRFSFPQSVFRDLTYDFIKRTVLQESFEGQNREDVQEAKQGPSPMRIKRNLEAPAGTACIIKPRFKFLPPPSRDSEGQAAGDFQKRLKEDHRPKQTKPNLPGKNKPQYKGSY